MSEWDKIAERFPTALSILFERFVLVWDNYTEHDEEWIELLEAARARYESGRTQHSEDGSTWAEWTRDEFEANIQEELIDAVIYMAKLLDANETS